MAAATSAGQDAARVGQHNVLDFSDEESSDDRRRLLHTSRAAEDEEATDEEERETEKAAAAVTAVAAAAARAGRDEECVEGDGVNEGIGGGGRDEATVVALTTVLLGLCVGAEVTAGGLITLYATTAKGVQVSEAEGEWASA